jgi:cell division protein FtsW
MKILHLQSFGHKPDYIIIGAVTTLVLSGVLFLASASFDLSKQQYGEPYWYLRSQLLHGLLPGIIGFVVAYLVYYRSLKKVALILLAVNVILLIMVFTPLGVEVNNARRWLDIGGFTFQPSEFLKFTLIVYLASLFSSSRLRTKTHTWGAYGLFLVVMAVVGGLIFAQPATTMVVVILGAATVVYLFGGASWKQIVLTFLIFTVVVTLLALVTPYRLRRLAPFWNPLVENIAPSLSITSVSSDLYHQEQARIAIGTGGWWGIGFGKSTTKYTLLPEPEGDSIFSVIAEEMGFVVASGVVMLYLILFWRATVLMRRSQEEFGRLLVLGLTSVVALQPIIHIAANTGLLPFTGVPLPFISHGGTALAVSLTIMGVVANVSRHAPLR